MTQDEALLLDLPTRIESERLYLDAVQPGDWREAWEPLMETLDLLKPWMPWAQAAPTEEGQQAVFARFHAEWHARVQLDFQWRLKSTGELVGKGGMHTIDWSIPKLEIGYWVRKRFQRQGFAKEAVTALAGYARAHAQAVRLEICSSAANAASRRVAEAAGFTLEGILRKARRDVRGRLEDHCIYAKVFA